MNIPAGYIVKINELDVLELGERVRRHLYGENELRHNGGYYFVTALATLATKPIGGW